MTNDRTRIEQSIAALEAQRAILGSEVVDLALSALKKQLEELSAQATDLEEQRKMITVLFADVPALAALSERVDAEDLGDAMNALWRLIDETILSNGGKIDKHIGHGVMALWGADQAKEDDPERAILAALSMRQKVADFNASGARSTEGWRLALRVGINTGQVVLSKVATTQEYTAIGDAVNVASRLQNAVPAGGVLISHDTYRHVRGVFDVQVLEPINVKGKKEALQVYLVLQAKPRALRKGMRGVEGIETHMVGRDPELQRLQETMLSVFQERQAQIVTIIGEAGIGKSRLLHEFDLWSELRPEQFFLLKGRAHQEMQNIPFALIHDLLVSRFEILESDSPTAICQKMESGLLEALSLEQRQQPQAVERARQRAHLIGQLIGFDFKDSPDLKNVRGDADQLRDRALAALDEYLKGLAAQLPVLMFMEDIHWADSSSLDLVSHLSQSLHHLPIFMLCASRPSLFERRPLWGEGLNNHTRMDLAPLSRRDSLYLVDDILQKVEHIPDALREMIVGNAEGNPFYVEELIKMLIDDGVIIKKDEHWAIDPTRLVSVKVPPTLTGLLQARFDSLLPSERDVLQRASVIGRVFWDQAVAYLNQPESGAVSPEETARLLSALRKREMIFQRESSTFANVFEYIFKHALLRDTIYESVLKRERRIFHARTAEWLIEHSDKRSIDVAGLIAEHLERAGQDEKATLYLNQASQAALEVSAYREALNFSERSLAILPAGNQQRIPAAIYTGEALLGLSDYSGARKYFEEALELARRYGDELHMVRTLDNLGWIFRNLGQYQESQEKLEECLALARKIEDTSGIAKALASLGWLAIKRGEYAHARQYFLESEKPFRELGASVNLAYLLIGLGIAARAFKDYSAAETYLTEGLSINREIGNRSGMASCFTSLGETARLQGLYTTARSYYKAAYDLDREIGDLLGMGIDLGNMGHTSVALDDLDEAIRRYTDALRIVMPTGATPYALDILAGMSLALAKSGQAESALELAGLVLHHPTLMEETRPIVEQAIEQLGRLLTEEEIQAGIARGKTQSFESYVSAMLENKAAA